MFNIQIQMVFSYYICNKKPNLIITHIMTVSLCPVHMWCISGCFFCVCLIIRVCTLNMRVSVWTTHSASMCTQQVSFPDSPVRRWFLFWEPSPQWHQLPPTHQPSPWNRTKTFLAHREGEHHAWHIYRRGLCAPLLSYPPPPPSSSSSSSFSRAVFVQPPALFTRSSKSFSDFHGCSTLGLACSLYLFQPRSLSLLFRLLFH